MAAMVLCQSHANSRHMRLSLVNGHRPPAKSALQKMARGGEGGSARRENKPYITGAEAKVYATLKSDTIMVIVVHTDSHAD